MRFKVQTKPERYSELRFFPKSGYPVTAYYVRSYSEAYEGIYKEKLIHIEFYGDTISPTAFKSWFGEINESYPIEEVIKQIAQNLENQELQEYPEMLAKLDQRAMF